METLRSFNRAEWGMPESQGAGPQPSVHLSLFYLISHRVQRTQWMKAEDSCRANSLNFTQLYVAEPHVVPDHFGFWSHETGVAWWEAGVAR